jgi:hypothetical protein
MALSAAGSFPPSPCPFVADKLRNCPSSKSQWTIKVKVFIGMSLFVNLPPLEGHGPHRFQFGAERLENSPEINGPTDVARDGQSSVLEKSRTRLCAE